MAIVLCQILFFVTICFISTLALEPLDTIEINTKDAIFTVDPKFLSVGLDSDLIARDERFLDFRRPEFFTLCDGLCQPGEKKEIFLRIGGGVGDNIIYHPEGLDSTLADGTTLYVLNNTEWDEINLFVERLQWRLVFGLNLQFRRSDGSWDPTNAIELIRYTRSKGYDVQFELGNEPDLYYEYRTITVDGVQLARDFSSLHTILQEETGGNSSLFGPDVATLTRFGLFLTFLQNIKPNVIDAVSYHHYYGASTSATVHNFTDPHYQDRLMDHISQGNSLIRNSTSLLHTDIWLGETSSTFGGGAAGLSNAYVAGFLWLDKLGVAARMGISLVFRWSLAFGKYSIIQQTHKHHVTSLFPLPDYWLSVLYKQLVGTRVLDVTNQLNKGRYVRTYAHCVYKNNHHDYPSTDITLLMLNDRHNRPASLAFEDKEMREKEVDVYLLSPMDNDLHSKFVLLNGNLLEIVNGTFPSLKPVTQRQPIVLPPLTFGFAVIRNANAKACL